MPKLEAFTLDDLWLEDFKRPSLFGGKGWYGTIVLKVAGPNQEIRQFVLLLRPGRHIKPRRKTPDDKDFLFTIEMDEFEMKDVKKAVNQKFAALTATTWQSFEKQMKTSKC